MSTPTLRESQLGMARFLRNPESAPAPEGVEARRLRIYQDLIYNNVEGFISGGFPVLRSLYQEQDWQPLVRAFLAGHRCQSPYFLEISQEFIRFLLEEYSPRECDPPFMAELAHYEWVELALDVAEEELPAEQAGGSPLDGVPRLSPLAWVLSYQFPVHRIGPGFQPAEPGEPTYLAVYRDREDSVRFMELNAATARLLELARDNTGGASGRALLQRLATEMGMEEAAVLAFGAEQLESLAASSVLLTEPG